MTQPSHDLIGVGIGPSNLSLAALLVPVTNFRTRFLDRRSHFNWHPGLMLPGARLQTSFLKDLVTAVDPTSPHSFLSYLVAKKRFYDFVNAAFDNIGRSEFADYLAWVAKRLDGLHFSCPVREIDFDGTRFVVRSDQGTATTANLCIATGNTANLPDWANTHLGERCFHASEILQQSRDITGKRVAVVGGGQTGAEVFLALAQGLFGTAASVNWISRRPNFDPLDETHFANEIFTPDYLQRFFDLPEGRKPCVVDEQKLKSDGISPSTLREIYHLLYQLRHLSNGKSNLSLMPGREVFALQKQADGMSLSTRNHMVGEDESLSADIVVLCTGYRTLVPEFLEPLATRIESDNQGRPQLNRNFGVLWDGPSDRRIYMQNCARHSHGIADPQLSLMAWRSAAIVNDLIGRRVYDIEQCPPVVNWQSARQAQESDTVAA
ncbi:lysine N(6)-hydroxylase/L-ornithine N(5)-oxygenase family protein [Pelagibius sp. Alg239-R121]|uniref:lysine N(6)-hydroxylase/L-ornithine N(5)-oxygenase family protein n=1 Tax=Pelagibius sp. Alg239-R121 TaxID=2993448 RepID=UPI0024A6E037|nr:SidA/IucD/PvdA family monooxygenase [Pelagibius sp. Alg239-R121]